MSAVPPHKESISRPGGQARGVPVALRKAKQVSQGMDPKAAPCAVSAPRSTVNEGGTIPLATLVGVGGGKFPKETLPQASALVLKGSSSEANRNLVLGVFFVLALVPIGGLAFWWAPRESFVAAATALVVGLLMFLALQFRILLQRNGVFLLLAGGGALTLLVPIGVRVMATGSEWAQKLSEFQRQQSNSPSAERAGGPAAQASAQALPVTNDATVASPKSEAATGAQTASKGGAPASEDGGAKKDAPSKASAPEKEAQPQDPARLTQMAKDEAIRRYPELQVVGTHQHTAYLDAYNALVRSRKDEFFKDPQWPLKIAEILASSEGWVKLDDRNSAAGLVATKAVLPGAELDLSGGSEVVKRVEKTETAAGVEAESRDTPFEAEVKSSQREVIRLYPAVGVEGSSENKAYQACFEDLNSRNTDFFDRPDWPLRLVSQVAKQENWKRPADVAVTEKAGEEKNRSEAEARVVR